MCCRGVEKASAVLAIFKTKKNIVGSRAQADAHACLPGVSWRATAVSSKEDNTNESVKTAEQIELEDKYKKCVEHGIAMYTTPVSLT